jgi:hypothetical protein
MHHSPRSQFDNHEHRHGAEEDSLGLKEITSPNLAGVITQERGPGLFRGPMFSHACHILLDRALADLNAKLPQFSPNALHAQSRVLPRHLLDQNQDILN